MKGRSRNIFCKQYIELVYKHCNAEDFILLPPIWYKTRKCLFLHSFWLLH